MFGKILFVAFLITVSGQDLDELIARVKAEGGFLDNPCAGREGPHFAINTRGCSWYFACNGENEVVRQDRCPDGLSFDYDKQTCNFKDKVLCNIEDDRTVPQICPTTRGSITVIPHPYSCTKYTVCFDGLQNDRDCPAGKHFSYYDGDCVDPFLADCGLDADLCRSSQETGAPVLIPNSRDCGSYYVCVGKQAVPLRCDPRQHFLPEKNWCVPEEESECKPNVPVDTPDIPEKISTDCEGATGIKLPHPESCQFYFFCAGNRSYLFVCGDGLLFDIESGKCQTKGTCILDSNTEAPGTESPPIIDDTMRKQARKLLSGFMRL